MKRGPTLILIILLPLLVGGIIFLGFSMGWFSSGSKAQEKPVELKEYTYALGDFTVNLDEPGYKRYMKVNLSAGFNKQGLDTQLEEKKPQINDIVNSVLRSKKLDDVNTSEKTDKIKNEIKDKINALISEDKITGIYLNSILIQ